MRKWILLLSGCAFSLGAYLGFMGVLELIPWLISSAGDPGTLIVPEITTFFEVRTKGAILIGLLFAVPFISLLIHSRPPVWRWLLLYTASALSGSLLTGCVMHGLYGHIVKASESIGAVVFFSIRSVRWEWIPAIGCAFPIGIAFLLFLQKRFRERFADCESQLNRIAPD